jgi:hypothetical protein
MRFESLRHSNFYPSIRHSFIDSFLNKGAHWMTIDYIPWDENPLVLFEKEAIISSKVKKKTFIKHEWRYKGKIYHRDVFNNVWKKEEGIMKWIGIYNPEIDIIDFTAFEPK